MKTCILTFSPTGTSSTVAHAIASGTGIAETYTLDVTYEQAEAQELGQDTLAIVSVPVYGGHVAPLALKRLEQVYGHNTPAVAAVVYGNRHYENALNQLSDFLDSRGFRVVAAGTFIGEHSYSTPKTPIAVGRPNAEDVIFAETFGAAVMHKLSQYPASPAIDVSYIETPSQDSESMMSFKQTVIGWMQQGVPMPSAPQVNTGLCTACGTCVDSCPTHAIPADSPNTTETDTCIKCCACVKACPQDARSFSTPFSLLLHRYFATPKANKTLL